VQGIGLRQTAAARRGNPRRVRTVVACAVAACLGAAGCGGSNPGASRPTAVRAAQGAERSPESPSAPAKAEHVRISLVDPAVTNLPVWVADDENLFAKYGLQAQIVKLLGGSSGSLKALAANQIDFANIDGGAVVAAEKNASLRCVLVATGTNFFPLAVFAAKGVASASQLRGKAVAVTAPGDLTDYGARAFLAQNGLTVNDVKIVHAGSTASSFAMLQKGLVSAAVFGPPFMFTASDMGFPELGDLMKQRLPWVSNGFCVRPAFLISHRAAVTGFVKAWVEAVHDAVADPAPGRAAIARFAKISDPKLIDRNYRLWLDEVAAPYPTVDLRAVEAAMEAEAVTGEPPGHFVDNSFSEALKAARFADSFK
jgi:NitT/TauT family transport system substrate-binding protein